MPPRKKSPPDVLDVLSAYEARSVLRTLLEAHPQLIAEARAIATRRLSAVDRLAVAEDVVACIDALGVDDLAGRVGRQVYGYVEPADAAWEVLEEALAPFTREVQRLLALGLEDAARAQCEGILLGLHEIEVDHSEDELVQYAPDFPREAAGSVLQAWSAASGGPRQLDHDLLSDHLFEWVEMVERIRRRGARTGSAGR